MKRLYLEKLAQEEAAKAKAAAEAAAAEAAEAAAIAAEAAAKAAKKKEEENKRRAQERIILRTMAQEQVNGHNPQVVAGNKHKWFMFTVPEMPVAGEDCAVYFNKNMSGVLRWAGGKG